MKKVLQNLSILPCEVMLVDMAVGIIIGGAFGKIVSSVVGDLIMPAVGLLVGGMNFSEFKNHVEAYRNEG